MVFHLKYGLVTLLSNVSLLLAIETQPQENTWPEMPLIRFCIADEMVCPDSIMKWIYNGRDCVRARGTNCTQEVPNRFQSKPECMNFCHGARCHLPPADYTSGPCKDRILSKPPPVWVYFNSKCVQWEYSGCGGSTNNFETEESCVFHCLNPKYNDAMPKPQM